MLISSAHHLVIDQGGHASRAMVIDGECRIVASAYSPLETYYPILGWVEHDPEQLIDSIRKSIDTVLDHPVVRKIEVLSAGLAIQRSSIVCWDRGSGRALSPVLSWQDRRNADALTALNLDPERVRAITGLVISPHYGASKLLWCLRNISAVSQAQRENRLCFGPLSSFVLHRLLDEHPCLVDPANASRTLLWDARHKNWSQEMLDRFELPEAALPVSVASRHTFGTLTTKHLAIPLLVATGDQSAALFAWGEPVADTLFVNMGTGAFLQQVADANATADGLLRSVVWQDAMHSIHVLEGTVNGAGSALDWLAQQEGLPVDDLLKHAEAWMANVIEPPLFINGVGGLGAPYWVPNCPVRFVGEGQLPEKTVAVLESIVFLIRTIVERLVTVSAPTRCIRISGGLAKLDALCQCLADCCQLSVERPKELEATAQGMAFLLGCRRPVDSSVESTTVCFNPKNNDALEQRYRPWRDAMQFAIANANH